MKTPDYLNNPWRKTASAIYRRPVDSKVLGSAEIDVTNLKEFIDQSRAQGTKITYTHIFTLAAARAIKNQIPELNTYVKRGSIVLRDHVDVTISVLLRDNQMGSVLIRDADQLTLGGLVGQMNQKVKESRQGSESRTMRMKNLLAQIPWPFRNWFFRLVKLVTMNWGVSIPSMGLTADSFGSFVVTNIGNVGLEVGFPALFPTSNVSFVLVLGRINKKPWVVDEQIVPRLVISIGVALDHRVADASHGGKLFSHIKHYINNPHLLEMPNGAV